MSRPLRVVHVLGRLSPGGGVQVVVRRLADEIDPTRVDLHVITTRPLWDDLSAVPVTVHPLGFTKPRMRPWDRVALMAKVAVATRRLRADLVQLHSGVAWLGLLSRLISPRTPFVLEVHDAPGSGRHSRSTDRFEGWIVRNLRVHAVCHSRQVEAALQEESFVPSRLIRRFPLGIDTRRFTPSTPDQRSAYRAANGLDTDAVIAVAVGRRAASKRWDLAVEALAEAHRRGSQLHLLIIGVGEDEELRSLAGLRGISPFIHLWDGRYGDDVAAALAACDILCSTSEYEGFGLTIIEGMAAGLPTVVMAAGGVTDLVVDGETGFLVPVGDVSGFADRLVDLERSANVRCDQGGAGRRRAVDDFDVRRTAAAFDALYHDLTER